MEPNDLRYESAIYQTIKKCATETVEATISRALYMQIIHYRKQYEK